MQGSDVRAVQRALNKWSRAPRIDLPVTASFGQRTSDRLQAFQGEQGIKPATGVFGERSLEELWPFFDTWSRTLYRRYRVKTEAEIRFDKMYAAMKAMNAASAGYLLGGGHGKLLEDVEYDDWLDCSSSSSKALWAGDMFPFDRAIVSGDFMTDWGRPGPGSLFTVYANKEHVWIRLHRTLHWRFDTSPHGDPKSSRSGPRLRYLPRFTGGFVARHWPGM